MHGPYPKLRLLTSAILLALGGQPLTAYAQNSLEEIVVTARRRAESFQDVPVTITVFSEADIRNAGIERPQDFVSLTPNVTLVETQNQGNAFITIRGISQARNSEPSVAVLVDLTLLQQIPEKAHGNLNGGWRMRANGSGLSCSAAAAD